eukprot:UN12564
MVLSDICLYHSIFLGQRYFILHTTRTTSICLIAKLICSFNLCSLPTAIRLEP